jgi:hypothetical protein
MPGTTATNLLETAARNLKTGAGIIGISARGQVECTLRDIGHGKTSTGPF